MSKFWKIFLVICIAFGAIVMAGCHGGPHISACSSTDFTQSGTDHAHPVTYIIDSVPTGTASPCLNFDADHIVIQCAASATNARSIRVHDSTDVIIQNCTFTASSSETGVLTLYNVDHSEFKGLTFSYPSASTYGAVQLIDHHGNNNNIHDNTFDGGASTYVGFDPGFDDGILFEADVDHETVNLNSFNHYWDACIENTQRVTNSNITSNNCSNAKIGIGGWYDNSWDGNFVSANRFTNMNLWMLYFGYTSVSPDGNPLVFTNNWFNDNDISSVLSNNRSAQFSFFSNLTVDNNSFSNNDFLNTLLAPYFGPDETTVPNAYNDSGGNTCGSHSTPYALSC
jgi:hypothetical protein